MNSEIIAVGTELLMGQIANTNAQYISKKLAEIGVNVYYHTTVGDNKSRLIEVLNTALNRSDMIILTGGLGPTDDDMTKETVSEFLGLHMVTNEEAEQRIKDLFIKIGKEMTKNNIKQAMIPEGSAALQNDFGTAPGVFIKYMDKMIVILPGPPREMAPMFNSFIDEYFLNNKEVILSKYVKVFGIPESTLEEKIYDLVKNQSNPTAAIYCGGGEICIRVTAKAEDKEEAEKLLGPSIKLIKERLEENVYDIEGKELEEIVVELLKQKGMKLSVAESCTGGMVSVRITSVPGSSEVFERGFITYSNRAKVELLGVKEETLKESGAVSEQTAREMADGARLKAGTDISVAITGIAGPGGATENKPIGLVYIAVSDSKGTDAFELRLAGNRERIRTLAAMNAMDLVRRKIK